MSNQPLRETAAYRLWHRKYQVRIPRSLMYGPEYVNKVGIHVTGDYNVDSAGVNELMTMWQTGAGLALLYRDGADIESPNTFVHKADKVPLYEDIQRHLLDWRTFAYSGIHPDSAPPISDFRMLEAVAIAIHYDVQKMRPTVQSSSALQEAIMGLNRRRNLGVVDALNRKKVEEEGQIKPYVSIVDDLEEYLLGD